MSPFLLSLLFLPTLSLSLPLCRDSCGPISINYPFGIDDGCGAPQYRQMLNCSTSTTTDLFFQTPSGNYKVQSINYPDKTLTLYDPSMSTCSILQPHKEFILSDTQSLVIPPSPETVFALINCSVDSPVLNHYKSLCFNFSGHSCDELYTACTSFKLFRMLSNGSDSGCCFTGYSTVKFMSMNVLDCTHYTAVYGVDKLKGVGPVDWLYGIQLAFSLPEIGCDRCRKSGGTCGFDVETEGMVCICSRTTNSTRDCAAGSVADMGESHGLFPFLNAVVMVLGTIVYAIS